MYHQAGHIRCIIGEGLTFALLPRLWRFCQKLSRLAVAVRAQGNTDGCRRAVQCGCRCPVQSSAIAVLASQAAEKPAELKPGAGLDKVVAHCDKCHGLDYILMNGGFLDNAGWDAEVAKMINGFGAQVDQADAKVIAEYLGTNYGP